MFKAGQLIYGIEVLNDVWDEAEISGYLYMGECENYIICCPEYAHHKNKFEKQLEEMYEESIENFGVTVILLKKNLCFETINQANDMLDELINNM